MAPDLGVSLIAVLALALIHVLAGRVHRGEEGRSTWLSAASGMSVAYVFVYLLPELAEAQELWLEARPHRRLIWLERQVYLAALVGVLIALGVDRATARPGDRRRFWLETSSFAVYNLLIGVFSVRLTRPIPLVLAVLAFGAHFLVNDRTLQARYGRDYERTARWILAAAILAGWLVAVLLRPPVVVVAPLLALLSGGIILNVIKEELPEQSERRFAALAAGAIGYSLLLLALSRSMRAADHVAGL